MSLEGPGADIKDAGSDGTLKYDKQKLLGTGSDGTRVYEGSFNKHDTAVKIAIKRIQYDKKDGYAKVKHEVEVLQNLTHRNVVRYFHVDQNDDFIFIALELCRGTLIDAIDYKVDVFKEPLLPGTRNKNSYWCFKKDLLCDIAKGLTYIHENNHVHRDLKPQNILIKTDNFAKFGLKAVISDFGLCRPFRDGRSVLSVSQGIVGTHGWMPREVLSGSKKIRKSIDIFPYGCIVQYVMSEDRAKKAAHPFGDDDMRNMAIRHRHERVSYVTKNLNSEFSFAKEAQTYFSDAILADLLIDDCICDKIELRPTANSILCHPFFWSYSKRVEFIEKIFNSYNDITHTSEIVQQLETQWKDIHPEEFSEKIPEVWKYHTLWRDVMGQRPPRKSNIIFGSLIRILHNLLQQWNEAANLYPILRDVIGSGDNESIGIYFFERIPMSFPAVYNAFRSLVPRFNSPANNPKHYIIVSLSPKCSQLADYGWKTLKKFADQGL